MPCLSVIVPTLNEATQLPATLARLRGGGDVDLIVADGGSEDETVAIAQQQGARLVTAPRGRAQQMNAGAAIATGEILLFLHADTLLPPDYPAWIDPVLAQPGTVAGAFELAIDLPDWRVRVLEQLVRWRSRWLQQPYGDQGLFLRAQTFRELGGFRPLPIMEDYEFLQRLRRRGRVAIAPCAAIASGRRWQQLGLLRTTAINQLVILGYHLGLPPEQLARLYYRRPRPPHPRPK